MFFFFPSLSLPLTLPPHASYSPFLPQYFFPHLSIIIFIFLFSILYFLLFLFLFHRLPLLLLSLLPFLFFLFPFFLLLFLILFSSFFSSLYIPIIWAPIKKGKKSVVLISGRKSRSPCVMPYYKRVEEWKQKLDKMCHSDLYKEGL